jgi:TPR repeat protein
VNADDITLDGRKKAASEAFASRNFALAFSLSNKLVEENVASAMFTCGLIMEKGWLNGVKDFDCAYYYYNKLAIQFNNEEGYLGCVRIILLRHEFENRHKALMYCLGATTGRSKHLAFLLLGKIHEELSEPPDHRKAREAYLKSFFSGNSWALRKYAMSLIKSKKYFSGAAMHVIATIASPILIFVGGLRKSRNG